MQQIASRSQDVIMYHITIALLASMGNVSESEVIELLHHSTSMLQLQLRIASHT